MYMYITYIYTYIYIYTYLYECVHKAPLIMTNTKLLHGLLLANLKTLQKQRAKGVSLTRRLVRGEKRRRNM